MNVAQNSGRRERSLERKISFTIGAGNDEWTGFENVRLLGAVCMLYVLKIWMQKKGGDV